MDPTQPADRLWSGYFPVAIEAVDVSLLHALFYAASNRDLETMIAVD